MIGKLLKNKYKILEQFDESLLHDIKRFENGGRLFRVGKNKIGNVKEKIVDEFLNNTIYEDTNHYIEGENCTKAIEYAILEANKAKLSYSNEEAISYYEEVKKLLESDGYRNRKQLIAVCQNLIEVYLITGRTQGAIELSQQLLDLCEERLDKAKLLKQIGTAYFKKGNWRKSEEYLLKALDLLGEKATREKFRSKLKIAKELLLFKLNTKNKKFKVKEPISKEIISIYEVLGWVYILSDTYNLIYCILRIFNIAHQKINESRDRGMSNGTFWGLFLNISKISNAIKYQEKASDITENLEDELGIAKNMQLLGFISFFAGNNVPAVQYFKNAKEGFEKIGDLWELGMVYNGFSDVYFYCGDYDKCIETANKYLEISKQIDNVFGICGAQQHIACCMIETGNYLKAEIMLKHILNISEENDIWSVHCTSLMYFGALEIERNNYEEAIKYLEEAKEINSKNNFFKQYTVLLYTYLAEAYIKKLLDKVNREGYILSKKDVIKLYYLCKEATTNTKNWNQHYGQAMRVTAQYYNLMERYNKAGNCFNIALEHTEKNNRLYELAKTYYEIGFHYLTMEDTQEAMKNWQAAYKLFKKIGSAVYIEQCIKLLGIDVIEDESSSTITINTTKERLVYERRINTVASTSRYISSILDIDQLLEKIMDSAVELIGAERGVLFLYEDRNPDKLEIRVLRNMAEKEIFEEAFAAGQSIIKNIEISKRSKIINDALVNESFGIQSSVVIKRIRSVICSPIMNRGHMLGIIYLDSSSISGLFSEEDLKILDLISNQAGVSIENARLYREMEISSKEIEESRDKTAKWNQTLEQRVKQRTIQLNGLNRELNEKNTLLESMNKDLKEYATAIEELSITRERNRVAIEVHDTLGHSLTLLLTLLEVAKLSCTKDIEDTKRRLAEATDIARNGMSEIRRSISGLLPERLEDNNLIGALERLISKYQSTGINVEMSVDDINIKFSHGIEDAIYKICQEAMTNSVRHGKATEINIILRHSENIVKLYIFDNGIGCKKIKEDVGLYGMRHRIEKLGGSITFSASCDLGFSIRAEIKI